MKEYWGSAKFLIKEMSVVHLYEHLVRSKNNGDSKIQRLNTSKEHLAHCKLFGFILRRPHQCVGP